MSENASPVTLRVLFFASLREAVGHDSLTLRLDDGSFAAVRRALGEQLEDAADALWAENVRLARNHELLRNPAALEAGFQDGDELAFLPPVTGG